MKVVVYDDEMLEPITVINLPGFGKDDIERHGRVWRVAVPRPLAARPRPDPQDMVDLKAEIVELFFEPFWRNSKRQGQQYSWICFTRAIDLVLLLNPSWLMGQKDAVNYLSAQNERLTEMLMNAIGH